MNVLLTLSTKRHSEKAIDAAIQRASVPDGTLVDLVILTRMKRSNLTRFLSGSAVNPSVPALSKSLMNKSSMRA